MATQPVHVDINQEIQDWQAAQYGREVRAANVSALTKLQDQTNAAVDYVVAKGNTIDQTVQDVQTVRQEAQDAVDHANDITAQYKQYADTKLEETIAQRQLAETARHGSESAATLSESWAHGSTGVRPGEDTQNSKYHSERASVAAARAKDEADRASMYADFVTPDFILVNNRVYINRNSTVAFLISDNKIYFKLPA